MEINDKHVEIIVRQMLKKVKIEDPGDTDLLLGSLVDIGELEKKTPACLAPAVNRPQLGPHCWVSLAPSVPSLSCQQLPSRNHRVN